MKLKYISLIIAIIGAVTACNITDIEPKDALTDVTYWKNISDLEIYTNRLYGQFPGPSVSKDNVSDNFITTDYSVLLYNEKNVPASKNSANWNWTGIRACNFFMTRYHTVIGDTAQINRYVGEVRFFRALAYFDKIKQYGDVPWYDRDLNTNDKEELFKGRDSRDLVLSKIIEDLEFAIQWLPDLEKVKASAPGRITKDVARTQLARVCLHEGTLRKYHSMTGNYTSEELIRKAATTAKEIMDTKRYQIVAGPNNGCGQLPFDGYPLNYSNQFIQEDLIDNKECILPRIYIEGLLTHNTGRTVEHSRNGLSKDFIESFLCKDGLPIGTSPLYKGDESLDDEITDRDPRLYQIVDNWHKPYTVVNGERQINPYTNVSPDGAVTGYPCVKFRSPLLIQQEANRSTYDWFLYRYAEVLLIYAEAKAELGECTQSVLDETINQLRDRVGVTQLTTSPVADPNPIDYGYTISSLLYEIRRERRVELIAEGFRLDDIIRWKATKLFENPKTVLGIRITPKVISIYDANTFGGDKGRPTIDYQGKTYLRPYSSKALDDAGRKWTSSDKRYLDPIPVNELVLNPNLKQNPGW